MPPVVIILFFAAIFVVVVVLAHRAEGERKKALRDWAIRSRFSYREGKDESFEGQYPMFSCLTQGAARYAENIMRGDRGDRGVCAFDYHYETYSTDSKGNRTTTHHRFSAVVFETGLPLKGLALRPEGFFDRITEFFGMDDIDFELAEFSRAFYVTAKDRRWAFDVFHQETMEFLLGSPRFRIEMAGPWVIVRRQRRLSPDEFSDALGVGEGILDRLPRYLLRELKGEDT